MGFTFFGGGGCRKCLVTLCPRDATRSTNSLERFNQELKRRTRVVRIFPNAASCLRLVSAMSIEQSEEWLSSTRKYLDMSEVNQAARMADSRSAPAGHTQEEIM